ncbi:MAG: translation initiation factor eIF-1A [Candidatus Altiarchaeales archaeon]|nr:MAG: translation initiation factor eIF-1A [Candidatus Altiarchaeales archaeon]
MAEKNKRRENKNKKGSGDVGVIRVRIPRKGQVLGEVEQLLGNRRMLVKCTDGHTRLCRIPGKVRKRIWINEGSIVLVEPWSVQENERGDILWRYTSGQVEWLEKKGFLKKLVENR